MGIVDARRAAQAAEIVNLVASCLQPLSLWTSLAWSAGANEGGEGSATSSWQTSATPTLSARLFVTQRSWTSFTLRAANPDEDVDIIQTELILADLGTIERALPKLEKEAKRDKGPSSRSTWQSFQEWLNEGNRAADMGDDH